MRTPHVLAHLFFIHKVVHQIHAYIFLFSKKNDFFKWIGVNELSDFFLEKFHWLKNIGELSSKGKSRFPSAEKLHLFKKKKKMFYKISYKGVFKIKYIKEKN